MSDKLVDRLEKAIRKTIDAEAQNHQGTELEWFEGLEEALDLIADGVETRLDELEEEAEGE